MTTPTKPGPTDDVTRRLDRLERAVRNLHISVHGMRARGQVDPVMNDATLKSIAIIAEIDAERAARDALSEGSK